MSYLRPVTVLNPNGLLYRMHWLVSIHMNSLCKKYNVPIWTPEWSAEVAFLYHLAQPPSNIWDFGCCLFTVWFKQMLIIYCRCLPFFISCFEKRFQNKSFERMDKCIWRKVSTSWKYILPKMFLQVAKMFSKKDLKKL